MNPISRFTLERHGGPYESWPLRSRLFLDGELTGISLPGYELLHQFECRDGFVLVTDYDCPFEEMTNFILVSKNLRLQSCRWLGGMYESFLLQRIEWVDERNFVAVIYQEHRYLLTIRSWWIPYFRPRLRMKYLGKFEGKNKNIAKEGEPRGEPVDEGLAGGPGSFSLPT